MEQQYVVINIEKTQTISAVLERHILRVDIRYEDGKKIVKTWTPDNADAAKAMLNRELVSRAYIDPLTNETKMRTINQAIRHRIEEADIKKLRPGQNTALEIILTGSPETLNNLNEEGLEKWVKESMEWAEKTWGKENIVTAVLHRDEKTPHIHLIVVPIVQGLSRRSKARDEMLKRAGMKVKTKKRNTTENRLSANEVYTQPRLYAYHTSYAKEVGAHFGLKRGIRGEKGSRKNPQKSIDFNRELERQRLEKEALIAELKSDYSAQEEKLQKVNDNIALAQEELQKVNDDMAIARANLQLATEAAAHEEEKRKNAKREADKEEARLDETKRLIAAEQEKYAALQDNGLRLMGAIKQMEGNLEKGRDLEGQIAERENYFRSLGSKSLLEFVSKNPELIKQELNAIVGKYFRGEVDSFKEREVSVRRGATVENEMMLEMKLKSEDGAFYSLAVNESDGRVWYNGKPYNNSKSGEPVFMKEVADYCTRTLSPEGKEFVASMYKRTKTSPEIDDPAVYLLRKKYGEITVSSASTLRTNGKDTGRMYHFTVGGKKRTAVWDYDSKEVCTCEGHAKKGVFYLQNWVTFKGNPAVADGNRVYSLEYKRKHQGRSI